MIRIKKQELRIKGNEFLIHNSIFAFDQNRTNAKMEMSLKTSFIFYPVRSNGVYTAR